MQVLNVSENIHFPFGVVIHNMCKTTTTSSPSVRYLPQIQTNFVDSR